MTPTLAQRYTYGNFGALPDFGPEQDFFIGMPARQRELLSLAHSQLEANERATRAILSSNITAADMICRELQSQTDQLRSAVEEGADAVVAAVANLSDRLAGELTEIQWELLQARLISGKILEVLQRPRSTEAHELLGQGVRHLLNDKLEQAEERFRLALHLDSTDYQVLLNLSAVELRKGNALGAIAFAHDALTLPPSLDVTAKANALWHLARVHYAISEYAKAFAVARQAVALAPSPRHTLQVGIYAMLAGDLSGGLSLISDAVRSAPELSAVAASTPDLAEYRDQLEALLDELANQALEELADSLRQIASESLAVRRLTAVDSYLAAQFRDVADSLAEVAVRPSLSECRDATAKARVLLQAAAQLGHLNRAELESQQRAARERAAAQMLEGATRKLLGLPKGPGCIAAVIGFGGYLLLALTLFQVVAPSLRIDLTRDTPATLVVAIVLYSAPFWIGLPTYMLFKGTARRATAARDSAQQHLAQEQTMLAASRRECDEYVTDVRRLLGPARVRR